MSTSLHQPLPPCSLYLEVSHPGTDFAEIVSRNKYFSLYIAGARSCVSETGKLMNFFTDFAQDSTFMLFSSLPTFAPQFLPLFLSCPHESLSPLLVFPLGNQFDIFKHKVLISLPTPCLLLIARSPGRTALFSNALNRPVSMLLTFPSPLPRGQPSGPLTHSDCSSQFHTHDI